jgi:hypothetical protein
MGEMRSANTALRQYPHVRSTLDGVWSSQFVAYCLGMSFDSCNERLAAGTATVAPVGGKKRPGGGAVHPPGVQAVRGA